MEKYIGRYVFVSLVPLVTLCAFDGRSGPPAAALALERGPERSAHDLGAWLARMSAPRHSARKHVIRHGRW